MKKIILLLVCFSGMISVPAQDNSLNILPHKTAFRESYTGITVEYGSVVTPKGYRVRTILTKPTNTPQPVPVIVFIQALSCGTIQIPSDPAKRSGDASVLADLILQSGYAVLRTEKPGMGDSEGPACAELDFQDELDAHAASIQSLFNRKDINPSRIILFGSSMGASMAPLLATKFSTSKLIVSGGFAKTWLEHMLEIERRRLLLSGTTAGKANAMIADYSLFYTTYLIQQKTPQEVLALYPTLKPIWYDQPAHQYGRPARFYQQVQQQNILAAWEKIRIPVLILYGEYDWIMSEEDHHMMADAVNKNQPGLATFYKYPKMSHDFLIHPSMQDAFDDKHGRYDPRIGKTILQWLQQ